MRSHSKAVIVAMTLLVLTACTSAPFTQDSLVRDPSDLIADNYFNDESNSIPGIEQPELFSLPDNYRAELDRILASNDTEYERYRAMRSWIYRKFRNFDFDVTETYSLAQLNTNRKINCLSFSVLFVAAARYVDVPAEFQLVLAPPYWDKEDNNWINNQHINVTGMIEVDEDALLQVVDPTITDVQLGRYGRVIGGFRLADQKPPKRRYTADINPAVLSINSGRRRIDEQQVLSLFYSNKAIEALLDQDLSLAYAYTKQALVEDPDSVVAWNNLGVLYSRVSQHGLSRAAYERAISLDENAYSAKSNLANNYRSAGMNLQAEFLEREIAAFRSQNPYYHSALAEESLAAGELESALDHLETAVEHKHNEQYFYHQLAQVNQQLGDRESVLENLNRARRYARGSEKVRFAGKLQALEALYGAND